MDKKKAFMVTGTSRLSSGLTEPIRVLWYARSEVQAVEQVRAFEWQRIIGSVKKSGQFELFSPAILGLTAERSPENDHCIVV